MPKVSVLMPIYKTNKTHLREAIESILKQTYTDFEFLILNDSPEETYLDDIVSSYNDKRIIYTKNEKNMGITPSRNKLIDMAKGEYLAVMDHDDISLPLRFEKQAQFLDEHEDYGVVSCHFKEDFSGQRDLPEAFIQYPKNNSEIQKKMFFYNCIMHPCSMLRKCVLTKNNIQYEENFSPAEDYRLWCRLIGKTKFYNIDEDLFRYRNHIENTSNTNSNKMKISRTAVLSQLYKAHPTLYIFARLNRKFYFILEKIRALKDTI